MKRFSALIITIIVTITSFAQGSVTVTQSSAISDIVNNNGAKPKQQATTPKPQTQQPAKPQTQQTQQSTAQSSGNSSSASSEKSNAGGSSEVSSSHTESSESNSEHTVHTYSKQPQKKQQAVPGETEEERLARHIQERNIDYPSGPKIMRGAHKAKGWRIQIYNGGNKRVDRQKAEEMKAKIKQHFPNMPVYVHFYSPRWMTMCGNYRTHKEAEPVKKQLINLGFKNTSIVRQQIVIE